MDLIDQRGDRIELGFIAQLLDEADPHALAVQIAGPVEHVDLEDELAALDEGRVGAEAGDRGAPVEAARVDAGREHQLAVGRDFDCDGTVVRGEGRGRGIGVPTANITVEGELLPRPGIYAVRARVDGVWHPAAASLGTNPTFVEGGPLVLEVHLLDFDGDLYGKRLRVAFHTRLRDEARFPSVDALVAQIQRDIDAARAALKEAPTHV